MNQNGGGNVNPGLALGFKDKKDIGKILNCLFGSFPPTDLDKETVKQAVKHFIQDKIELFEALNKFAFPFVSQKTEEYIKKVCDKIIAEEPDKKYVVLDYRDDTFLFYLNIVLWTFYFEFSSKNENVKTEIFLEEYKEKFFNAMNLCDMPEYEKEIYYKGMIIAFDICKERFDKYL